jgi:DNA-binding NarL/FixJ family response regulator
VTPQQNKNKTVLLLDSGSPKWDLTPETFSPFGIELLTASTPEQALDTLSSKRAYVFVVDITTSGVAFIGTVRERFPDLAIVVMVGFNDGDLVNHTQLGGLATTILKGFSHQRSLRFHRRDAGAAIVR